MGGELAAKPDDLSSVPRTNTVDGLACGPLTYTWVVQCTHVLSHHMLVIIVKIVIIVKSREEARIQKWKAQKNRRFHEIGIASAESHPGLLSLLSQ